MIDIIARYIQRYIEDDRKLTRQCLRDQKSSHASTQQHEFSQVQRV